jgi:hypothetical protein
MKSFIIICNATPASLHEAFTHVETVAFARTNAFVNAEFDTSGDKMTIKLHGHAKQPRGLKHLSWSAIECLSVNSFIKSSPCKVGTSTKVFFKQAKTLDDYIVKLSKKQVTKAQHNALFKTVLSVIGSSFVNHNQDVATLHFKNQHS